MKPQAAQIIPESQFFVFLGILSTPVTNKLPLQKVARVNFSELMQWRTHSENSEVRMRAGRQVRRRDEKIKGLRCFKTFSTEVTEYRLMILDFMLGVSLGNC